VERAPSLTLNIEEVNFTVSVRILTTNENDFCWGDREGRAGPQRVLHANSQDNPGVLVDVVDFNRIIDLLFSAAEEATEGINELIVDCAGTQIVTFVLHDSHLSPLIALYFIFLNRVQSLLAAEATEDVYITSALGDSMGISTFVHRTLIGYFIALS